MKRLVSTIDWKLTWCSEHWDRFRQHSLKWERSASGCHRSPRSSRQPWSAKSSWETNILTNDKRLTLVNVKYFTDGFVSATDENTRNQNIHLEQIRTLTVEDEEWPRWTWWARREWRASRTSGCTSRWPNRCLRRGCRSPHASTCAEDARQPFRRS